MCGRMVAFDAGTYHGVQPLLRGRRCALAMWYTLDARHREADHAIAQNLLKQLYERESIVEHEEL